MTVFGGVKKRSEGVRHAHITNGRGGGGRSQSGTKAIVASVAPGGRRSGNGFPSISRVKGSGGGRLK